MREKFSRNIEGRNLLFPKLNGPKKQSNQSSCSSSIAYMQNIVTFFVVDWILEGDEITDQGAY